LSDALQWVALCLSDKGTEPMAGGTGGGRGRSTDAGAKGKAGYKLRAWAVERVKDQGKKTGGYNNSGG